MCKDINHVFFYKDIRNMPKDFNNKKTRIDKYIKKQLIKLNIMIYIVNV